MRLVTRQGAGGVEVDAVLGSGLVGQAVTDALARDAGFVGAHLEPTDWTTAAGLEASLQRAGAQVQARGAARVRVFHCAGRAGFSATDAECALELASFERVLRWAEALGPRVEFHFASSAGGLHEGQLLVSSPAAASPRRPYGRLKWAQEQALLEARIARRFVYRLSSVYGLPAPGRRAGLVATMVLNALRRRSTRVTAYASTLRDYVEAADVASYMTSGLAAPTTALDAGVTYLVHGQALSVTALQVIVERHLFAPIRLHYATDKDNFASITFSPRLKPAQWASGAVATNVPRIVEAVRSQARAAR